LATWGICVCGEIKLNKNMDNEDFSIVIKLPRPEKIISWFFRFVKEMFVAVVTGIGNKKYWSFILLIVEILIFWKFGIIAALVWLIFFSTLIFKWNVKIIIFCTLVFLGLFIFFLAEKKDILAEQTGIYVFYFLVMIITLRIIQYTRGSNEATE
jgi:hypothetical protein